MAVNLTKKDWVSQVKLAATSTYLNIQGGTCVNVKVGKSTMDVDDIGKCRGSDQWSGE